MTYDQTAFFYSTTFIIRCQRLPSNLSFYHFTRHHFGGLPLHSHHINHLCSKGIVTYIAAILSRDQKHAAFTIHFIYLHRKDHLQGNLCRKLFIPQHSLVHTTLHLFIQGSYRSLKNLNSAKNIQGFESASPDQITGVLFATYNSMLHLFLLVTDILLPAITRGNI